ncbi:MAG TPA: glycosyltransferase family 39 protein [Mycobacteriales bacterium]|nr:glycosyltransferase family 39 protein [Mycobacteriales bacterium]
MRPAVVAVLVVSIVLRFLTRSPLWLDEAQTVSIANRSVPHLFTALREDGAPPLYYLLLHYWMAAFGTSSFAVRSLSSVLSVGALPVMAVVAKRFKLLGDSPWPAVLLLATCPFVIRYATEARMYSLVLLLVLLALVAYERVWTVGGWRPAVAATVVTGALLLTQYWAIFMLATAGATVLFAMWRGAREARRLLVPMVIGCGFFLPWLPSFAYQSAHTGAPWGSPPGIEVPFVALGGWVGGGLASPVLRWAYYLLAAVAIFGYARRGGGVSFHWPVRRRPLLLLGFGVAVLLVGTVASEAVTSAYAPRYTMVAVAPILLVVAAGLDALSPRLRTATLAVVVVSGLAGSALIPGELRTQAAQVAKILRAAQPGDLVVFCPDQLGPAVHRLAPNAGRQVVYPTFGSAAMVDWVDYKTRNEDADPYTFAGSALQMAAGHTIWFIYETGYPTLAGGCTDLLTTFTVARGQPVDALNGHGAFETDNVAEFLAP